MGSDRARVALLARAGPVRDGLAALLGALPAVDVLVATGEWHQMVAWLPLAGPQLVVLDEALAPLDARAALAEVRRAAPRSRRLVLVDEVRGLSVDNGDAILVKGAPPAELAAAVQALLGKG